MRSAVFALELVCLALACLPIVSSAVAQEPLDPVRTTRIAERAEALRERLRSVSEAEGAGLATGAVDHARRALAAVTRASRDRDLDGAERALAIADAAITLADRLAARERARTGLERARRSVRESADRNAAARVALERALVERARVLAQTNVAPASPAP